MSPFLGKAMTDKDLNMKFWIVKTKNKGIMAADFPEKNHCDILYSERILKINGENGMFVLQLIKVTFCSVPNYNFRDNRYSSFE